VGIDPDLRILILSTPKTGNTWLRHLLAGVYRLPQFYVPPPLDCAKLDKAGERWVTHYHTKPNRELLSWIRTNRAVVVTTIRHPGDVLISLYHHVHEFRNETIDHDFIRRMLSTGFERRGMTTYAADQPFSADLDCSLEWMDCPGTQTIRFEDLRADPVAALCELTSRIHPAPLKRIEAAVQMCDIDVMRRMAGEFSGFFRQGSTGAWRQLLAPDVVEAFRSQLPYAAQVARLGYSMDPADTAPPHRPPPQRHPMTTLGRFENGVAVAPILVQCFFWAPCQQRQAWERQLAATGPDTFYEWLNSPAPPAGRGPYDTLPISNIAAFVYQQRPDVRLVYRDLGSGDRHEYVLWFLRRAGKELGLDAAFVDNQQATLQRWSSDHPITRLESFDNGVTVAPILVQAFFGAPDAQRKLWERQPAATGPGSFYTWLNSPAPEAAGGPYEMLFLSNIAAFVYEQRPDVRRSFKDLSSGDRYDYVRWFLRRAGEESGLDAVFVNRQRSYLLRWANRQTPLGGSLSTNFVAHLCRCRIDVDAEFPNISHTGRRALIREVVRAAKALGMDPDYIRPMQDSLGHHWLPAKIRRWCGMSY